MAASLHVHASADAQVRALALAIRAGLDNVLAQRAGAVLAVSGGRSPVALFAALRDLELPWNRVTISLVDERLVPPGHPDSNESLVREHLLRGRAAQARLLGLVGSAGQQALELRACVERANRELPRVDVAVLGMGEDGHTASLFPGAPGIEQALDADGRPDYVGVLPPHAPHPRISMSLGALLRCARLLLAIAGETKKQVYDAAAADAGSSLPVARLLHQTRVPLETHWAP